MAVSSLNVELSNSVEGPNFESFTSFLMVRKHGDFSAVEAPTPIYTLVPFDLALWDGRVRRTAVCRGTVKASRCVADVEGGFLAVS